MCLQTRKSRKKLTLKDRGLGNVPDGSSLDHVSDQEALDGLVLGNTARAVDAADRLCAASPVLGASVVSSFLSHFDADSSVK